MRKGLRYLMPSLPQEDQVFPDPWTGRERCGAEWSPHNQDERVSDLRYHLDTQVYGSGWDPPKGTKQIGRTAHWDVFHHLTAVLTKWGGPRWQKLADVLPICKKGQKEHSGNDRPVSLTRVPGKVMEQIILIAITQHLQDSKEIRPS